MLDVPISSRDKNFKILPLTKLISIITGYEFAVPSTTK
jgi:hypothetical protein